MGEFGEHSLPTVAIEEARQKGFSEDEHGLIGTVLSRIETKPNGVIVKVGSGNGGV